MWIMFCLIAACVALSCDTVDFPSWWKMVAVSYNNNNAGLPVETVDTSMYADAALFLMIQITNK